MFLSGKICPTSSIVPETSPTKNKISSNPKNKKSGTEMIGFARGVIINFGDKDIYVQTRNFQFPENETIIIHSRTSNFKDN